MPRSRLYPVLMTFALYENWVRYVWILVTHDPGLSMLSPMGSRKLIQLRVRACVHLRALLPCRLEAKNIQVPYISYVCIQRHTRADASSGGTPSRELDTVGRLEAAKRSKKHLVASSNPHVNPEPSDAIVRVAVGRAGELTPQHARLVVIVRHESRIRQVEATCGHSLDDQLARRLPRTACSCKSRSMRRIALSPLGNESEQAERLCGMQEALVSRILVVVGIEVVVLTSEHSPSKVAGAP